MSGRNNNNSSGKSRRYNNKGRYNNGSSNKKSNNSQGNKDSKKSIKDLVYTTSNGSEFPKTTKKLLNYIQQTYTEFGLDIVKSLEDRALLDLESLKPTLQRSIEANDVIAAHENEQYKLQFQKDYELWAQRKLKFQANCDRAYAFFFDHCSKAVQNKIEARDDFESKIKNNPVELLKAIEQHSVEFQEKAYPLATIVTAWDNLLSCKQKSGESIIDYSARFKSAVEVFMVQSGGEPPIQLVRYAKAKKEEEERKKGTANPTVADPTTDELKVAWEELKAFLIVRNCDGDKYGSFKKGLRHQYSLGNDQYPKSLVDAIRVLGAQPFDTDYKEKQKERERKQRHQQSNSSSSSKKDDDEKADETPEPELTLAQVEGKCYCCGQPGHHSNTCKQNKKPYHEWAVNKTPEMKKAMHLMKQSSSSSDQSPAPTTQAASTTPQVSDSGVFSFMAAQVVAVTAGVFAWLHKSTGVYASPRSDRLKSKIAMDSASAVCMGTSEELCTGIQDSDEHLYLSTNTGMGSTTQKAYFKDKRLEGYNKIWYKSDGQISVYSLGNLVAAGIRVFFDSSVENAFTAYFPNGPVRFVHDPESNLYLIEDEEEAVKNQVEMCFVETVADNAKWYTPRQFDLAKRARKLMHSLGCPTVQDLKNIIKMNSIQNNPVTVDDVNLSEKIFGPDIASLKGKTVRKKPAPFRKDTVEIPPELKEHQNDVDLCFDLLFVNQEPFLTTVSKRLLYRTASPVDDKKSKTLIESMDKVLRIYKRGGFNVKYFYCDQEFKQLCDHFDRDPYNIVSDLVNSQQHQPEAERNNRVIQERIRAIMNVIPFNLPRIMIKYLVMEAARKLNFFPPKGGVSKYFSPREIVVQQKLDYSKHCSIPIFSYVQAHDEPNPLNTPDPRTLNCIYLRPTDTAQGGHEVFDLMTGAAITRRMCTVIPITQAVIDTVNAFAKRDGMDKLRVTTKTGQVLWDSSWTAGVDYEVVDEDDNNDEDDDNDNDDDSVPELEERDDDDSDSEDEDDEQDDDEDSSTADPVDEDELADIMDSDANNNNQVQNDQGPAQDDHNEVEITDDDGGEHTEHPQDNIRRSTRASVPPRVMNIKSTKGKTYSSNAQQTTSSSETMQYSKEQARVIATVMQTITDRLEKKRKIKHGKQFVVTYSLKKGIAKFGQRGKDATMKEMRQLHDRDCWYPVKKSDLNKTEYKRALESLIFLVEKRDGTIKARHCANGSTQRDYLSREDVSSPTVSTDATLLTATIEAEEERHVAAFDIPNAFIQTEVERTDKDGNRTIMVIRGVLVDILCEMDPTYKDYVEEHNGHKALYVHITKAIYGLLASAMLFYNKFSSDLKSFGFEINPYDPCVANKMVNGKQLTVCWHVDDLKASHKDRKVLQEFYLWLKQQYGSIGEVKCQEGPIIDYLGMKLDYSVKGQVTVDMVDYVEDMVKSFPQDELDGPEVATPWTESLFKVNESSPPLVPEKKELFHTFSAKGLFACKRARPDISPAIAYTSTRVRNPNEDDWRKLVRMMKFLKQTSKDRLTLKADGSHNLYHYVDASFAVHPDFRSHTGAVTTLGRGAVMTGSNKQGLNTRSSTDAEHVGADERIGPAIWSKHFLEAQGYHINENEMFQDNESAVKLETNGMKSAGKRSRHLNIRLFFITDQHKQGNVSIRFCPTDHMIADYMTKPLHGAKFHQFRDMIMNLNPMAHYVMLALLQ